MKKMLFGISTIVGLITAACNNDSTSSKENDTSKMNSDATRLMTEVTHRFTDVTPQVATSLKAVVDHYMHIKNALVNNDGIDAANGGKAMAEAMRKVDHSLLAADQMKVYDGIEGDLKENAEHIGKSSDDIAHQREHFAMMSEDVYDLVKAFGGGRVLYYDHCPMAHDNKGANWLSETKEVKNPYFGGKMNECVNVPEVIR